MYEYIKQPIEDFYIFFDKLHDLVKPPELIDRSGFPQFRYEEKNVETLCLIKNGRLISSLNAIALLFEKGYFLEIAILIRTIKECCADILFLLENYPDKQFSKAQEQYLDEFFQEEYLDPHNPIQSARQHKTVSSRKIHAGYARNIYAISNFIKNPKLKSKVQKLLNPHSHQDATLKILKLYSGYVHYGYTQSMDFIGGDPPSYHLEGMSRTPMERDWYKSIVAEIDALYNYYQILCMNFNFAEEFEQLKKKQKIFHSKNDLY